MSQLSDERVREGFKGGLPNESFKTWLKNVPADGWDFARQIEVKLASCEQKLKELSALPMPLPADPTNPFYIETMEQAEFLKEMATRTGTHQGSKLETIARKLEYMAQAFTCTANFVPLQLKLASCEADKASGFVRMHEQINELLKHCNKDGGECFICSTIICPFKDELHFHHDGCPSCDNCPEEQRTIAFKIDAMIFAALAQSQQKQKDGE